MKTIQPNELLVRWNIDGSLSGYHLKTITVYTDDQTGEVIVAKEGDPMTATQAEAAGFPLVDILDAATLGALKRADAAEAALAQATARP